MLDHGDSIALWAEGRHVSYRELAAEADAFAARLGAGRKLVFLELENDIRSIVRYLGCLRGGHAVHIFNGYADDRLEALVEAYAPHFVVRADGDAVSPRHDSPLDLHTDLQLLLSTSGSTGTPKLVKLSARNIQSNAEAIASYLGIDETDRAPLLLPLHYSYGLSVLNSHLQAGATLLVGEWSVESPAFWDMMRAREATSFAGVPYTFEMLERAAWDGGIPTLRYSTQAGGRLDPRLVQHFAGMAARQGWRFFVMYGQTEAAPRMAYLPPESAEAHPDCIGIAIPGGAFSLVGENGAPISAHSVSGELVYRGPNVMMGYAASRADLASDDGIGSLRTGDIACRNEDGLYRIVGRVARFVKPFGTRINLDDVEARIRTASPAAIVAGDDRRIVLAVPADQYAAAENALPALAAGLSLPPFVFAVQEIGAVPRLPSGKTDYAAILRLAAPNASGGCAGRRPGRSRKAVRHDGFIAGFGRQFGIEVKRIIGLGGGWESALDIYRALVTPRATDADTFITIAGDSLSYVQVSLALEEYLGALPEAWETMRIDDLEETRHGARV